MHRQASARQSDGCSEQQRSCQTGLDCPAAAKGQAVLATAAVTAAAPNWTLLHSDSFGTELAKALAATSSLGSSSSNTNSSYSVREGDVEVFAVTPTPVPAVSAVTAQQHRAYSAYNVQFAVRTEPPATAAVAAQLADALRGQTLSALLHTQLSHDSDAVLAPAADPLAVPAAAVQNVTVLAGSSLKPLSLAAAAKRAAPGSASATVTHPATVIVGALAGVCLLLLLRLITVQLAYSHILCRMQNLCLIHERNA
jgi:hypothetical protein